LSAEALSEPVNRGGVRGSVILEEGDVMNPLRGAFKTQEVKYLHKRMPDKIMKREEEMSLNAVHIHIS